MKILGLDPSGNFEEGKGTTGWCLLDTRTNHIDLIGSIRAQDNDSQTQYWDMHLALISEMVEATKKEGQPFAISMEDYLLYARCAQAQTNSRLETPQLIGVIKYYCYKQGIELYLRPAVIAKKRWTDKILVHKGYINIIKGKTYLSGRNLPHPLCDHEVDAMRHALHCSVFEIGRNQ